MKILLLIVFLAGCASPELPPREQACWEVAKKKAIRSAGNSAWYGMDESKAFAECMGKD